MGKRILAIDDDPEVLDLLRDYLMDKGFEVATPACGADIRRLPNQFWRLSGR